MSAAVEIVDVGMRFGEVVALDHVESGGRTSTSSSRCSCASGCGKTTLLMDRRRLRGPDQRPGEDPRRGRHDGAAAFAGPTNIVFQRGALSPT